MLALGDGEGDSSDVELLEFDFSTRISSMFSPERALQLRLEEDKKRSEVERQRRLQALEEIKEDESEDEEPEERVFPVSPPRNYPVNRPAPPEKKPQGILGFHSLRLPLISTFFLFFSQQPVCGPCTSPRRRKWG